MLIDLEELCLEQIMEQLCNTPESEYVFNIVFKLQKENILINSQWCILFISFSFVQAEIIIRDDAKFVQARPSDVYLWSLELTPNRSDLCRFIIQSSQGQTGRVSARVRNTPSLLSTHSLDRSGIERVCEMERWRPVFPAHVCGHS